FSRAGGPAAGIVARLRTAGPRGIRSPRTRRGRRARCTCRCPPRRTRPGGRTLPHAGAGGGHRPEAGPALLDLPTDAVTVRPLPRSRLDGLVPSLVAG